MRLQPGRWLVLLGLAGVLGAAEARLRAPALALPGKPFEIELAVTDPPSSVSRIVPPTVDWLGNVDRVGFAGTSISILNGVRSVTVTIPLQTSIAALGRHRIPPFTVVCEDGTELSTAPVDIEIGAGDASLVGQEAVARVRFEPPRIVPGQDTEVHYEVLLRNDLGLAIFDEEVSPAGLGILLPAGLELGERLGEEAGETFDAEGAAWTQLRYRFRCTAVQPGEHSVGGQQQLYRVRGFRRRQVGDIPIQPGLLTVVDFPAEGRPPGFAGLIGPLSIDAALERETVRVGEGTVLGLEVRGRALGLLVRPDAPQGEGFRCRFLEATDVADGRRFTWNIEPQRPGRIELPPFAFDSFDPDTGSYGREYSRSLVLEVLPGREAGLVVQGASGDPTVTSLATPGVPGSDLAFLQVPLQGRTAQGRVPAWLILLTGLGTAFAVALLARQRSERRASPGREALAALRAGDQEAAGRHLHAHHATLPPARRQAWQPLLAEFDAVRFGGARPDAELLARLRGMLQEDG